jgi:hypothetical protein
MARNAWRVWGISAVMAGGLIAADKPAELPVRTEVQGRSTPAVTEEHFQAERVTPPRLLPVQIRDGSPTKDAPPVATDLGAKLVGFQPGECIYSVDLDFPIRGYFSSGRSIRPSLSFARLGSDWEARAAFDIAEMHFRSCDAAEARLWYHEVIKLAPKSDYATLANERLQQTEIIPAGAVESREPPLADAPPVESVVRIR